MENTASVIAIGNELLNGQGVDTNRSWLGKELMAAGINVLSGYTVSDHIDLISDAIGQAAENTDIILLTGGLGPTDDDVTRQAIADFLGVELVYKDSLMRAISSFFNSRGSEMSSKNRVQAYIPQGAMPVDNEIGTAPGIIAFYNGKIIVSMPGVPVEMKKMFTETILPVIAKQVGAKGVVQMRRLKCFGVGESTLAEKLDNLMDRNRNPLINCTVSYGVITLHIIASADTKKACETLITHDINTLKSKLGNLIFGFDDDELETSLGNLLIDKGLSVSTAESCTGGLISKMLTDMPGSSAFFKYGWVTYANEAKQSELGVPFETLDTFGAVSPETAKAMALGAMQKSGSDLSIAITGIAGPGGGTPEKPQGTVYIALADSNSVFVNKFCFPRGREFCRLRTAQTAINMLRIKLLQS